MKTRNRTETRGMPGGGWLRAMVISAMLGVAGGAADVQAQDIGLPLQAYLTTADGAVVDGAVTVVVRLYSAVLGGSSVHQETFVGLPVRSGHLHLMLGESVPLELSVVLGTRTLWAEFEVEGQVIPSRMAVRDVWRSAFAWETPRAERADEADSVPFSGVTGFTPPTPLEAGFGLALSARSFSVDYETNRVCTGEEYVYGFDRFGSLMCRTSSITGEQGPQGPPGPAGDAGPQGPTGPVGATGPQGPVGASGPGGPAGLQGPTGPVGAPGPIGITGAQGAQGGVGPIGPAGEDGLDGLPGASGPAGPPGPVGATGPQGAPGNVGPAGAQGPAGVQGPTGATGPTGAQGPQGATGPGGATGPQGPVGPAGNAGPAGPTGAQGPQGPQGFQGPAGPVGSTGPQGPQGSVGFQGAVGETRPATFQDARNNMSQAFCVVRRAGTACPAGMAQSRVRMVGDNTTYSASGPEVQIDQDETIIVHFCCF